MSATPEQIALVRLYIGDPAGATALLSDAQITALLDDSDDHPRLAAAAALEAIAASEVLVSKKIRTQDLSTDGPAVSAELRALAAQHRARHQELVDAEDDGIFDIVDTLDDCRRPEHTNHEVWGL